MRRFLPKLAVLPSDPLLTNRWSNVVLGIIWIIDGTWGLLSSFLRVPTISLSTPGWYEVIWSTSIAVAGFTAAFGCLSVFFVTPNLTLLNKKRIELYGLYWLTAFLGIYIALLYWYGYFSPLHDLDRAARAVLGTQLLLIPIHRIYQLNRRITTIISSGKKVDA